MRKLLLSATIVALSVNLATNISYAQTIITEGANAAIETDVTGVTGTEYGGAYQNSGTMTIGTEQGDAITISGNSVTTASEYGYGGFVQSGGDKSQLTIFDKVTFNGNTASLAGGALSLNGGLKTAIHDAVTFTGNKAEGVAGTTYGGAIYITTARDELNLETGNGTQFTSNEAGSGGAIYANDAQIKIGNQANFSGNKATAESGGAIYSWDSDVQASKGVVTVGEEATFDQNEAAWSGGAIANFDGKVDIEQGAQFTTNKALDGNGGAIANNVSVGTVKDTQLNIAGNTTFSGNSVASTSEGYGRGGAIYNAGTVNLDSTEGNITFQNNTASDTGSDVYLADGSVMNVTGSYTVSFQSGEGAIAGTGAINKTGEGTFELVNSDISNSYTGTYTQEAGTLLLDGSTMSNNFDIKDGNLVLHNGSKLFLSENGKIANGTITVGDSVSRAAGDASVLTLKKGGQIASVVDLILQKNNEVIIETDSSLIYGGQGGDLWAGKVTLKGGTLNYEGLDSNGQLVAETGNLNINNGTLNVAGADAQNASSIASDVVVDIKDGATMVVGENGTVTINSNDKWAGDVKVDGSNASLTIDGMTSNGGLTATTGSVNLAGGSLTLANGSSIADAVNTTITGDVNLTGGSLALNSSDSWTGNITVNDTNASLTIDGMTSNGGLTATTGSVNLAGGSLTLANGSSIANAVNTTITGNVNIADGSLALNSGDSWTGNITVNDTNASLTIDGMTSNGGLTATTGSVNLAGGSLTLANGSSIADAVNTTITGDVNIADGSLALNSGDSWTGNINQTDGQLDYSLTQNGGLTASGGIINVTDSSKLTLVDGSSISGTTETNVTDNSTLTVGNKGSISGGTTTVESGNTITVTANGEITGGTVDAQSGSTFNNAGIISDGADIDIATSDATNSGEIAGGTVDIANGGALENSGTISGGTTTVASGGSVTVTENGEITGGTTNVETGATFDNAGTISDDANVSIAGTGTNSGEIAGGTVNVTGTLENSGTISGGTTTIANGGSVTVTADGEIIGGTTNVAGTLINNGDIIAGDVNVTGTVNNNNNIGGNTNLTIDTNGNVVVGDGATVDTKGAIEIAIGGTLTINEGGEATLKENDIWAGDIVNTNGTLTLVGRDDSGKNYSQTGGELVLNGSEFELGGSISGGTVTVSNGSSFDVLDGATMTGGDVVFVGKGNTVNVDGIVTADAEYEINNNNTINIKENGSFVANSNDIWTDGTITVNGGKLDFQGTIDEQGQSANGILHANTGEVDINSDFTMINGSYIAAAVDTDINQDTTLNSGSSLELNTGDTWASDATVTINGGSLVYDDLTSNGHIDANTGNLTVNSGTLTVDNQSDIAGAVNTTIAENATVNITGDDASKGSVSLNGNDSWDGTVTINGGSLEYALQENGKIQANTGDLNIVEGSTLTMADTNDVIADAVDTTIKGTLNVANGNATLNDNDIWTGTVHVSDDGTLNLNNVVNGTLIADGGTLNFQNGVLNMTGDSVITGDATTNLTQGTVNINNGTNDGGSVTLNDSDSWASDVTVNLGQGGKLDYDLTSNGTLKADGGQLTTQDDSQLTLNGDSYINKEVSANLAGDTTIQNGATVSLGDDGVTTTGGNDILTGDVTIDNGGTLNLFNDVAMKDPVAGAVNQSIAVNGTMNLETTGELHLNADLSGAGDINKNGEGDVWFHGQNGGYTGTILVDNGGDLLFENGLAGNLVFGDIDGETIGIHADAITGDLTQDREATIMYTTYHDDVDLDLNGNIDVSKGTLIAESKGDRDINFGGTINVSAAADAQNPVSMDATSNGTITFANTVDVNKATMNVSSGSGTIFQNNVTLTDSILNATSGAVDFAGDLVFSDDTSIFNSMNGQVNANTISNLDMTNSQNANFQIDISTRDWKHDSFDLNGLAAANGGKINISDWQFIGKAPIDRHIKINVFDVDDIDPTLLGQIEFTQTDKQIFTPIGWYQMFNQKQLNPITGAYESIPGAMTASLVEYNPQVFRGQVSTVASYANQLVTNNILFDHIFTVSNQLMAENNANKYAAIYPQFAPYQYSRKDGSLWYKAYGTLETLHMNRGLDVDNTAYGALVGADFPVIEMKKGWSFLPTAYVGYNGAHQNYSGVGMYQNGGQLGAMGTFMKNDFLGSLLLYGGGYGNQMDVAGYHDHTGNWFVGTAAKAAYNFHPTKHFTIQPTLLASYNYFHTQNWFTEFGDMRMNAGRLNGINVAPGLNLIYGRETWSMYATIQYMFNILGTSSGNAGNVVLPDMRMQRSYIEYGVGATKTWKDRFSAYLQITVRNIGRTGIGFQGGFNFKL